MIDPADPQPSHGYRRSPRSGPVIGPDVVHYADRPFWVGGSRVSYNYDAVAYNGSGIVPPVGGIGALHSRRRTSLEVVPTARAVMDIQRLGRIRQAAASMFAVGSDADAEVLATNWLVRAYGRVRTEHALRLQFHPEPIDRSSSRQLSSGCWSGSSCDRVDATGRRRPSGAVGSGSAHHWT